MMTATAEARLVSRAEHPSESLGRSLAKSGGLPGAEAISATWEWPRVCLRSHRERAVKAYLEDGIGDGVSEHGAARTYAFVAKRLGRKTSPPRTSVPAQRLLQVD